MMTFIWQSNSPANTQYCDNICTRLGVDFTNIGQRYCHNMVAIFFLNIWILSQRCDDSMKPAYTNVFQQYCTNMWWILRQHCQYTVFAGRPVIPGFHPPWKTAILAHVIFQDRYIFICHNKNIHKNMIPNTLQ